MLRLFKGSSPSSNQGLSLLAGYFFESQSISILPLEARSAALCGSQPRAALFIRSSPPLWECRAKKLLDNMAPLFSSFYFLPSLLPCTGDELSKSSRWKKAECQAHFSLSLFYLGCWSLKSWFPWQPQIHFFPKALLTSLPVNYSPLPCQSVFYT